MEYLFYNKDIKIDCLLLFAFFPFIYNCKFSDIYVLKIQKGVFKIAKSKV